MRVHRFLGPTGRVDVGASSVEYALIAALIAAIIVVGVATLGQVTTDNLDQACEPLEAAGAVPCD